MKRLALLLYAALACLAIGCGGDGRGNNDSDRVSAAKQAVDGFIDALLGGDGAKACSYLSAPGKASVAVVALATVTGDEARLDRQVVNFDCARRFDEYISALGKNNLKRLERMDFRQITDPSWYPPPEADPQVKRAARESLPFSPDGDGLKDPVLTVERISRRWKLGNVPDPQEDFPARGAGRGE